jgi:hypothetical protein
MEVEMAVKDPRRNVLTGPVNEGTEIVVDPICVWLENDIWDVGSGLLSIRFTSLAALDVFLFNERWCRCFFCFVGTVLLMLGYVGGDFKEEREWLLELVLELVLGLEEWERAVELVLGYEVGDFKEEWEWAVELVLGYEGGDFTEEWLRLRSEDLVLVIVGYIGGDFKVEWERPLKEELDAEDCDGLYAVDEELEETNGWVVMLVGKVDECADAIWFGWIILANPSRSERSSGISQPKTKPLSIKLGVTCFFKPELTMFRATDPILLGFNVGCVLKTRFEGSVLLWLLPGDIR